MNKKWTKLNFILISIILIYTIGINGSFYNNTNLAFESNRDIVNKYTPNNDVYSVSDDDFISEEYINKTNENFKSFKEPKGYKLICQENPFFTNENTYQDIENSIKNYNFISSRDEVPINKMDINFYNLDEILIDKNSNLTTSDIKIKISYSGDDESLEKGETEFITGYKIPYINIDDLSVTSNNFYDFDYSVAGNYSQNKWVWNGKEWDLLTNQPFHLSFSADNINEFKIGSEQEILLPGETKEFTHKQIDFNNSFKPINKYKNVSCYLINKQDYKFDFNYRYETLSYDDNDVVVSGLNGDPDKGDVLEANKKMWLDNNDGVVQGNEILKSNLVQSPFTVTTKKDGELKVYKYSDGYF